MGMKLLALLVSGLVLIDSSPTRHRNLNRRHSELNVHNSGENEVIKDVTLPKVPPDALEAYYYDLYEDMSDVQGYRERPGDVTDTASCAEIREVPTDLRIPSNLMPQGAPSFYQKYTEAYGIPVLGSAVVSDAAMRRACYVLRFLLADRADLRSAFYESHGRLAVIGRHQHITNLPEYSFLPAEFSAATRGLGSLPVVPVSSGAEENLLCEEQDFYLSEDILLREVAVGLLRVAVKYLYPEKFRELQHMYNFAIGSSWWVNTYAERTADAYFGEGVQSFFNANGFANYPDGRHSDVNTRPKLRYYDVSLSNFVQSIFPCANHYIQRCNSRGHEHYQVLDMNCAIPVWDMRYRKRRR